MPSYDYRCSECKTEFTVERSMKDESKQPCPACGSENASRIWTVVAFSANGSTPDYGQGTFKSSSAPKKSACACCTSKSCGTCH